MPDIGVAAVHHDLHAIAAAGLIAVADEAHVAGGVVGLWKVGAGHCIVSAFELCTARQKLARLITDRGLIGIEAEGGNGGPAAKRWRHRQAGGGDPVLDGQRQSRRSSRHERSGSTGFLAASRS